MGDRTKEVKRVKINGKDIDIVEATVVFYEENGVIERYVLTFESKAAVREAWDWLEDNRKSPTVDVEFVLYDFAETYKGRSYISTTKTRLEYVVEGSSLERVQ